MTQVAPAAFEMRQIKGEDVGKTTDVPNHPVARLMYYLNCVLTTVGYDDSDVTIRRLSDFKYAILFILTSTGEFICLRLPSDAVRRK